MCLKLNLITSVIASIMLFPNTALSGDRNKVDSVRETTAASTPKVWSNPGHMPSRDLFYGIGGRSRQPGKKFTFVKEDLEASKATKSIENE
jgi:hypothetical protein